MEKKKSLSEKERRQKKPTGQAQIRRVVGLVTGGILGFILVISAAFLLAYRGKIYPGVAVNRIPVGNQTPRDAAAFLQDKINSEKFPMVLELTNNGQRQELDLASLGFRYDPAASAQNAYLIGRDGNWKERFREIMAAWKNTVVLDFDYEIDQTSLIVKIGEIAAQTDQPVIEPRAEMAGAEVQVFPGQDGQKLDQKQLMEMINTTLKKGRFSSLEMPLMRITAAFSEEEVQAARTRLNQLVKRPVAFKDEEQTWPVSTEERLGWMSLRGGFNDARIASQAGELARQINRVPQNAVFNFENGKVVEFTPALKGRRLNEGETQALIKDFLRETENTSLFGQEITGGGGEKFINLPVETVEPEVTTEAVNQMGIKELLAVGRSNYAGSAASRIHNLTLASNKLNGILVPPGETFSFNGTIGEVSAATGYQSGFVIKEGKTILDDGGGVCQVSTTLFRAALNAGLPILERHPHSYRVSYYEQGGFGPGLDATVWIPGVDLKFKNDTPNYLLIQSRVDTAKKELAFEIYGTSDGRTAEISPVKYWSRTAPPPDLYIDDPALPAGTVKQTERAIWGAKVSVDWKVTRGEEVLQEKTFFSTYKAWQAVYLRGPAP